MRNLPNVRVEMLKFAERSHRNAQFAERSHKMRQFAG